MVRVELRFNGVDEPGNATRIGGGTPTEDLAILRRKVHDGELLPPRDRSKDCWQYTEKSREETLAGVRFYLASGAELDDIDDVEKDDIIYVERFRSAAASCVLDGSSSAANAASRIAGGAGRGFLVTDSNLF